MKVVNKEIQELSIQSLKSTFNKLSHAYQSMLEKGANTTLVKKRRDAVKIGLESLKGDRHGEDFSSNKQDIKKSKEVLESLIPSLEKQIAKAKEGSPQKTLNERRLTALQLAIESLQNRLK